MRSRQAELEALLAEGLGLVESIDGASSVLDAPPARRQAASPAEVLQAPGESHRSFDTPSDGAPVPLDIGRPSAALKPTWIDPEETPFSPEPRPGSRAVSSVVSAMLALALVAALAWFLAPAVQDRFRLDNSLVVTDGVLTAQAVELSPIEPARVVEVYIQGDLPGDAALPAGTPIARLERDTSANEIEYFELETPFDARLVSVDSGRGDVAYPGVPVATVFDPSAMEVVLSVPLKRLAELRRGMRAEMVSDTFDQTIEGTVVSAVPLLGSVHAPNRNQLVNVRIRPDPETALGLMPGLRLDAVIDLGSGDPDQPSLAAFVREDETVDQPAAQK